jgi:hypothetical protein
MITGVELNSRFPMARGAFADIYQGRYMARDIAVKCLIIQENGDERAEVHRVSITSSHNDICRRLCLLS